VTDDKKLNPDAGELNKSGIPILDETMDLLETIPKTLGIGGKKHQQPKKPGQGEEAESSETEMNPLQPALVRAMITSQKLARYIQSLRERPGYYGVVFSTPVFKSQTEKVGYVKILPGTRVKIIGSQHYPDLVGKIGYTANEPERSGVVMVLFDEGEFGNFVAVPADKEHQCEIEIAPSQNRVVVLFEGRFVELIKPEGFELKSGQVVKLDLETNQILEIAQLELPGEIATVKRLVGGRVEIDFRGSNKLVAAGDLVASLEPGNQVVLDSTGQLIIQNLGDQDVSYRFNRPPAITWSDIGGQQEAKAVLQEAIETRFEHPEVFKRFKKTPPKGLLLLGPTGCGKTMLAEAAAYSLFKRFGEAALRSGFFHIKGPEILRSLVGEQEAILRHVFILADKHFAKHKFPAVIFIDECEGIAKKRGTGISGDYHETLVQTLLSEMNDTTAIVILATNRPDILDPAVVRHKRIDRKIYVRRPDRAATQEIFRIYLKDQPLPAGSTREELTKQVCDELFSDRYGMYKLVVQEEKGTSERIFGLQHVLNGAMIWGIVDEATSLAVNRQIIDGREAFLTLDDLKVALDKVYKGELLVDHSEDTKEFADNLTEKIVDVHKLYQGRK
jgi:proteasome-associated ATPase